MRLAFIRRAGGALLAASLGVADAGAQLPTDLGGPPSWSSSVVGGSFVRRRGTSVRDAARGPMDAADAYASRAATAVQALVAGRVADAGGRPLPPAEQAIVADALIGGAPAASVALERSLGPGGTELARTVTGLAERPSPARVEAAVAAWNRYAAVAAEAGRAPAPTALALHATLAAIVDQPVGGASSRGYAIAVPSTAPRAPLPRLRAHPGWSAGSPIAYGAALGEYFAGLGYQGAIRNSDQQDGSVAVGFGLGNPIQLLGVEAAVASLSTIRGGFGNRNTLSVKVHRVLRGAWAVAAGVEHAVAFGPDALQHDGSRSIYGVVSNVVEPPGRAGRPFDAIGFSLGLGSGRFVASNPADSPRGGVAPFAIVGTRVTPWASLMADFGGEDLNLGLSLAPFPRFPLVVTPILADVLLQANAAPRFVLAAGLGFRLGAYRF